MNKTTTSQIVELEQQINDLWADLQDAAPGTVDRVWLRRQIDSLVDRLARLREEQA